ncbi:MAG: ZIP family metal transporter [Candidatus Moranbacteria bacterium]|nr:ZIP family metal transporter [Candidatus Moranbacteria bacterium]
MVWLYTLSSVIIISLISLVGIFTFSLDQKKLARVLIYLVSFSAGTLLGDAFIHLIPEAYGNTAPLHVSLYILSGIIIFFILEKFIHWRHCHVVASAEHPHPFSYIILAGDTLHNFIDGLIIAASFLVSIPVGIATTLAVVFHEIPQEVGDFGSLVYGGFSRLKALAFNFLTALAAVAGALLVLAISGQVGFLVNFLVPFAAGGFIYIASTDLIPELHKDTEPKKSFWQLITFILGIGLMFALLLLD